jgi:hypothetical protein
MYVAGAGRGGVPPPQEKPGARQAILQTIFALDAAKQELQAALRGPVIDTCGVFISRADTQLQHARNNLLRARTCLMTPAEARPYTNFRRVGAQPGRPY